MAELGYEIVSTGGSASAIEAAGVPVQRVEELTGFPEMLDGAHLLSMHACSLATSVPQSMHPRGKQTFL